MISYVRGSIEDKQPQTCILDVGQIGLAVHVTSTCLEKLPEKGHEVTLLTYLHVREDILQLYGFFDDAERNMFMKMTGISGIGPKQAMNILSALTPAELTNAILNSHIAAIKRAPGVGDKLARRIVLELKEKISEEETQQIMNSPQIGADNENMEDALAALAALGYRQSAVQAYFKSHPLEDGVKGTEAIIKWFLAHNKR